MARPSASFSGAEPALSRRLGFDYIWFSNGLGFSLSPWNVTGPLFDGKSFDARRAPEVRDAILSFWRDFRGECKAFSHRDTREQSHGGRGPVGQRFAGEGYLPRRIRGRCAAELAVGCTRRRLRAGDHRLSVAHLGTAAGQYLSVPFLYARSLVVEQPMAGPLRTGPARHLSPARRWRA